MSQDQDIVTAQKVVTFTYAILNSQAQVLEQYARTSDSVIKKQRQ